MSMFLEELDKKATDWPWVSREGSDGICNKYLDEVVIYGEERDRMRSEDVRLIVELRNALPEIRAIVKTADRMAELVQCAMNVYANIRDSNLRDAYEDYKVARAKLAARDPM